ncbi:MAG: SLBB domain-containing protein [Longimonas sp.]|uniref:SLBB domain-containing protein n=1 Tax=Longimonas sp. TaxID=2039626 RepID=UPI0033631636
MTRTSFFLALALLLIMAAVPETSTAQDVPPEVQRELDQRGMSEADARRQARELGIDLSDPDQAERRARELGIPESRINALLQAVEDGRRGERRTDREAMTTPPYPVLNGRVQVDPERIFVGDLPADIAIEIPLRSEQPIREVDPFFITANGDTARVEDVRRISGSVLEGRWEGTLTVPEDNAAGTWSFFTRAATEDTTVVISTGRRLQLTDEPIEDDPEVEDPDPEPLEHFGYDLFDSIPEAFQPQAVGPVDDSYIVSPNDELRLTVWGAADFQYDLTVDREGRVNIPEVGQITVAGKRLSELREDMKQQLSRSYAQLTTDPPSAYMDLTVTRLRPVQVFVLGEVPQPGGYTMSSFSTAFNALYSVGGPLTRGSLRNVQVIRNGEVISTVDFYQYLLRGFADDPVRLQNNDIVFVPPRGITVSLEGAVKRPAIYELREDEELADLIEYAGGLEAEAYTDRFTINRILPFEDRDDPSVAREVLTMNLNEARSGNVQVRMNDGDFVRVRSIRDIDDRAIATRVNRVEVTGAVFQPGEYQLGDGIRTVSDLIDAADGLTGDAFMPRAELSRVDDDLESVVRSLDLDAVQADDPTQNVVLRAGDSLHVALRGSVREERTVRISGQVRSPDVYRFQRDMTVRDLLSRGGGLFDEEYRKQVFMGRADLFRESPDGSRTEVIPFHLGDAIRGDGDANMALQPGDEIRIYQATVERLEERFVEVRGRVKDGGRLVYRDNMTLEDALLQAGGFDEGASLRQVEVTRLRPDQDGTSRATPITIPLGGTLYTDPVSFAANDSLRVLQAARQFDLQHRDRVFVRQDPAFRPQESITVEGEVRFPGDYTILEDNERLSDILERAGGIASTGYAQGGRLIRDDEQVISNIRRALEGRSASDVIVQPGDRIVIPTRPNTVAVRGNVANEGLIKHEPGKRVEYYLDRAGGVRENTGSILLTQASGATFRVRTGWFRRTPRVQDGATIRVIEEPEREREEERFDLAGTLTEITGILSSALTIIVLAGRAFD